MKELISSTALNNNDLQYDMHDFLHFQNDKHSALNEMILQANSWKKIKKLCVWDPG